MWLTLLSKAFSITRMLEQEFQYFKDHQDDLVAEYKGKYVAIVGDQVKGAFDTELEAYLAMKKSYNVGIFLIQECLPGKNIYTQTFHSRVPIG